MPAKRRLLDRPRKPDVIVTGEALAAFRRCKALRRGSQEWKDARDALLTVCSLSKFGPSPCDAEPLYSLIGATRAELDAVRRLRAALEQADREDGAAE